MARSVLPTWSSPRQACALVLTGATARTCLPVAAVVGTVLTVVNQGTVLLAGHHGPATVARVAANYVIPFCVSSYGALSAVRRIAPACPPVAPGQQAQHGTPPSA